MSGLDYFGVRPDCGCVTAWMAGDEPQKEVLKFYADMAQTGREVRRMEFTDELRKTIMLCEHKQEVQP